MKTLQVVILAISLLGLTSCAHKSEKSCCSSDKAKSCHLNKKKSGCDSKKSCSGKKSCEMKKDDKKES